MDTIYILIDVGLVLALPYGLYRLVKGLQHWSRRDERVVCLHCGQEAPARFQSAGSPWLELVLWFLMITPGVLYSMWRFGTRRKVCAACAHTRLAPPESMAARARWGNTRPVAPDR